MDSLAWFLIGWAAGGLFAILAILTDFWSILDYLDPVLLQEQDDRHRSHKHQDAVVPKLPQDQAVNNATTIVCDDARWNSEP